MPVLSNTAINENTDAPQESKALRLARYLKEFVGLRSTTVRDIDKYDSVLWFGDMPQESECHSSAWNDTSEPGGAWLEVRKQQFPKCPEPPNSILLWIDQQALRRAVSEMPQLRASILMPDSDAKTENDEDPPLVEHNLVNHPEVSQAYERFRPNWESWSAEYRRRERIQAIYAELFRMYTQVRKQGEIVELVIGLGLLDWPKPINVRRHIVSARVDLNFDLSTGTIRVESASDGAQLRIEDDMLDAELRPERGIYASIDEQLNAIGDEIWDHQRMQSVLKSWAIALHADIQWSDTLKPTPDAQGRPTVTLAPALILRKRTQIGMVRIYDCLIQRLSAQHDDVPRG